LITFSGCDNASPSNAAVSTASTELNGAGVVAFSPDTLSKGIGANASNAQGGSAQGTNGEKSASAILTAQAALAQGEKEAQAMTSADAEVRRHLARLNELAGLWSLKSAIASTAESFDPAPNIAELAKSSQQKDLELVANTGRRDAFQSKLTQLRTDAKVALDEAKRFSDETNLLRQKASALTAREGAPLIEQAAMLRRQGDAQRLIGEKLAAEADILMPQLAEQEALIQKINNQKAKLAEGKKGLEDRKASASKEAADAREAAGQINRELEGMYSEMIKAHDGQFQPAFDNAKTQFEKAMTSARGASEAGGTGKVMAGSAGLSVAGLQTTRLQMLSSIASTLDVLIKSEPALPRKADYQSRRSTITEESVKLLDEAKASIEQASSTFAGASVLGDGREKLQQLSERLKKLPEQLEPAPADGVPRGARMLVEEMIAASKEGRFEALNEMTHTTSDAAKAAVEAQSKVGAAFKKLNDASEAKFELGAIEMISKAPGGGMLAQGLRQADPSAMDISTMSFSMDGDVVKVSVPGLPMPMEIKQIEGAWKFILGASEPMVTQMTPMMTGISGAMEAVSAKIEAGEFSDASAAGAALMQEIQKALMGGG